MLMNKRGNIVKRLISAILSIALLCVLASCSKDQEDIYASFVEGNEVSSEIEIKLDDNKDKADSGKLTLSTSVISENSATAKSWNYIFAEFNKQYPNIEIELVGPRELSKTGYSEYVSRMTVELLSGEAGDIVDLNMLPYINYSESGVFISLDSYLENENAYQLDAYYTNVFDAVRYKDNLYCIPYEFSFFFMRLNKPIVDKLSCDIEKMEWIDITSFLNIYYEAKKLETTPNPFFIQSSTDWLPLSIFEYPSHIDEENEIDTFESNEFMNYLNLIKGLDVPEMAGGFFGVGDIESVPDDALCVFASPVFSHKESIDKYKENISSDKVSNLVAIESSNGAKLLRANAVAITSASDNQELAWRFVEFLLNNELKLREDNITFSYNPVRKETMHRILEKNFGDGYDEEITKIENWCSEVDTIDMMTGNADLWNELNKICIEYTNDLITVEECAKQMHERADIYMKE